MEILNGKSVLLVDDDEGNIYALSNYLELFRINVFTAKNGSEAIDMLRKKGNIHVVLLDMMMPVMDGYQTLALLKHDRLLKKIPVIAVTARAMKGEMEKCLSAGAWDYLSKPIDLKACIDKLVYYCKTISL